MSNKDKGPLHNSYKHGLSYMKEYAIFNTIKARCYNKNDHQYKYYGARGIGVCSEWLNNTKLFIDYVKGLPNYGTPNYSLDRINNNNNYEPGNLRWASKSTQSRNQRGRMGGNEGIIIPQSGYKGIIWENGIKKWRIRIHFNGKRISIGRAKTIEEAVIK